MKTPPSRVGEEDHRGIHEGTAQCAVTSEVFSLMVELYQVVVRSRLTYLFRAKQDCLTRNVSLIEIDDEYPSTRVRIRRGRIDWVLNSRG
jgi:hypothetical protein